MYISLDIDSEAIAENMDDAGETQTEDFDSGSETEDSDIVYDFMEDALNNARHDNVLTRKRDTFSQDETHQSKSKGKVRECQVNLN